MSALNIITYEAYNVPFYHLEPVLNFTHVLKGYANLDSHVTVRLLYDNKPMDCSAATGVTITADKYVIDADRIDVSGMAEGELRFSCLGLPVGGYRMPITVDFETGPIVFGQVTVFVSDTTRSDDIAIFNQYPDTDEELEEWEAAGDGDDEENDDEGNIDSGSGSNKGETGADGNAGEEVGESGEAGNNGNGGGDDNDNDGNDNDNDDEGVTAGDVGNANGNDELRA